MSLFSDVKVATQLTLPALALQLFMGGSAPHKNPTYQVYDRENALNVLAKVEKRLEYVIIAESAQPPKAFGSLLIPGRAGVMLGNTFGSHNAAALPFLVPRECYFVKNDIVIKKLIISNILRIISFISLRVLFPQLRQTSLTSSILSNIGSLIIQKILLTPYSCWQERKADEWAASALSPASNSDAIAYLNGIVRKNRMERNDPRASTITRLWRKFTLTASGNYRFDFASPSLTSRIQYLKSIPALV